MNVFVLALFEIPKEWVNMSGFFLFFSNFFEYFNLSTCLYLRLLFICSNHISFNIIRSLINTFILSFYRYQITETSELTNSSIKVITSPDIPKWYSQYFINIMGTFHFILAVWMLIEYFIRENTNFLLSFPLLSNML